MRCSPQAASDAASASGSDLDDWIRSEVSFVSTMVDRITPATTPADVAAVRRLAGWDDAAPVVAEPFAEWVLAGEFPAGRPAWEAGGARFVDDVEPFERRKLWLLNAGHSLLAYRGLLRGRATIADAVADPGLRAHLEQLWEEQRADLPSTTMRWTRRSRPCATGSPIPASSTASSRWRPTARRSWPRGSSTPCA